MRIPRLTLLLLLSGTAAAHAQTQNLPQNQIPSVPGTPSVPGLPSVPGQVSTGGFRLIPPRSMPVLTPPILTLLELEGTFQQAVIEGGGKAFGTFFAEDAVILSNGKPAVQGRGAIAAQAQWDPKTYQLTWNPEGAQMGPSGDMGFTWGHYDSTLFHPSGPPTVTSGRYFTLWKKLKDGSWKVAMDASADEPASLAAPTLPSTPATAPACCSVPHP